MENDSADKYWNPYNLKDNVVLALESALRRKLNGARVQFLENGYLRGAHCDWLCELDPLNAFWSWLVKKTTIRRHTVVATS